MVGGLRSGTGAGPSARTRVVVSASAAALGAIAVALVGPWWLVPLSGWDCGALLFLGWMWRSLSRLDGEQTRAQARREDPSRASADLLLIGASVVSLLAVGLVGMCVASVILAWSVVHTIFTLRYARLYYAGRPEGVNFNEDPPPCYSDFLYLALTIGMTFQVSDTNLTTKQIRRTALRHAVLSYMFGAIIVAATVNLIAGLSK
jgi:uncharacterized membrane protein